MRRFAAPFALALIGCGGGDALTSVTPPAGVATYVALVSDPGEPLGGGVAYDYSRANSLVTVRPYGAQLAVQVVGDRVWDGFLALSSTEARLRTGAFANLTNAPPSGGAGFRWSTQERTCAASVASVTIDSLKYDGDALSGIDLRFEQRCDGHVAALRGIVHWRASDDPLASGPLLPVPGVLWRAPAGATPAVPDLVFAPFRVL